MWLALEEKLAASDVFFDGNPFIGSGLLEGKEPAHAEKWEQDLVP